jgi:hypothetical protein
MSARASALAYEEIVAKVREVDRVKHTDTVRSVSSNTIQGLIGRRLAERRLERREELSAEMVCGSQQIHAW